MNNLIDQVIVLGSGEKKFVLNQAIYKSKNYYLLGDIDPAELNFTGMFSIVEENEREGKRYLDLVRDEKILSLLIKYLI